MPFTGFGYEFGATCPGVGCAGTTFNLFLCRDFIYNFSPSFLGLSMLLFIGAYCIGIVVNGGIIGMRYFGNGF